MYVKHLTYALRLISGETMKSAGLQERHFGVHLTLDGYGGSPDRLGDPDAVRAWLDELPEILGMSKLAAPMLVEVGRRSEKDAGGITGFVLIAESHISIHTFPLRRFASADVYTCQNHLDKDWLLQYFRTVFELESIEHNLIIRGTQYPLHDIHDDKGSRLPHRDARR
jgi:S-adenosylmethionine decarboxylase